LQVTSSGTPTRMLQLAAACAIAFAAIAGLAYYVSPAQYLDDAALHGFVSLYRPGISGPATTLAHLCNPFPYAIAALAVIAIGFRTKGPRTAAATTLLLAGANISSQTLKPLLAHHRELYYTSWHLNNINDAALPSGHATAAMALSIAALMVVSREFRPITAIAGAAFTIAVTFSVLILQWHFPSDVVCGYLIASIWGLVVFAGLTYANERWPEKGTMRTKARQAINPPRPATIAITLLALAAVAIGVALSRAEQLAHFADRHTAAAAVASAIAVAATVLLAAVAALSSRRSSR
jgi:membrane-associated phospholipid phosphatase